MPHAPVVQAPVAWGGEHARPHAPQELTLVPRLASQPFAGFSSQSAKPVLHVYPQPPEEHTGDALASDGQTSPHMPQLFESLSSSRHTPEQSVVPAAHETEHVPAEHRCPAAHARPHMPQWFASVSRSRHTPEQAVRPIWHEIVHAPRVQT